MNYEETLEYIHSTSSIFCKPGLERTEKLLSALGNPEKCGKYIHIAGTNGKGSTSVMLSEILMAAGYNVGLYTSPYVKRFNERMRFNGVEISDDELVEITAIVRPIADNMTDKPTEFELITAIAFEFFRRKNCDIVVLEVGMGGRLDSTNVINSPLLSVITGISLDHVAFLGDTVEKIAFEKAGIIKNSCPVLFGGEDKAALSVISDVAKSKNAPFCVVDYSALKIKGLNLDGSEFSFKGYENLKISMLGSYQPRNASLVISAAEILRDRGLDITEEAVRLGLLSAYWPARFEIIHKNPIVIFDGAHNAEGISAAVNSIKEYFGDEKIIVLSGVLADKEFEKIAKDISLVASRVFTITPDNPRALGASKFASVISSYGVNATPCENIEAAIQSAVEYAKNSGTALCCLGSLYTYGCVTDAIDKYESKG